MRRDEPQPSWQTGRIAVLRDISCILGPNGSDWRHSPTFSQQNTHSNTVFASSTASNGKHWREQRPSEKKLPTDQAAEIARISIRTIVFVIATRTRLKWIACID